jgi:hypothetical protein
MRMKMKRALLEVVEMKKRKKRIHLSQLNLKKMMRKRKAISQIKKVTIQVKTMTAKKKNYRKTEWTGMNWKSKPRKKIEDKPLEDKLKMSPLLRRKDTVDIVVVDEKQLRLF